MFTSKPSLSKAHHIVVLSGVVLAGAVGPWSGAAAQDVSDLQTPKGVLVLRGQPG